MVQFVPIKLSSLYTYNTPEGITHLRHHQEDEIRELLMGHSVLKITDDNVVLDNGVTIQLVGNDGGCACSSGCYDLTELNGVENIITDVKFESPDEDGHGEVTGTYRIFVFAGNQQINLASFDGTDGNGYYGTGYHLFVRPGIIEYDDKSTEIIKP